MSENVRNEHNNVNKLQNIILALLSNINLNWGQRSNSICG